MSKNQGAHELVDIICEHLSALSNPKNAVDMRRYMKDHFAFYGVKSPQRKQVLSLIWSDFKNEIKPCWRNVVVLLWKKEERECQYFAMDLMKKFKKEIRIEDQLWVEHLVTTKSWWDTVDFLAVHFVGGIFKQFEDRGIAQSRKYIRSENMWIQRSALLFQLSYKEETNADLLFELIDKSLGTKEFFINKAIGWALRQYSKFNPVAVRNYIDDRRAKMAGLSIREGSKYL